MKIFLPGNSGEWWWYGTKVRLKERYSPETSFEKQLENLWIDMIWIFVGEALDGGDNNDVVEFEKLQEEMGWLVPNKGGRYKCWVIKAEPKTATRVLTSKPKLVLIFSCFCQQWWSVAAAVVCTIWFGTQSKDKSGSPTSRRHKEKNGERSVPNSLHKRGGKPGF